MQVRARDVSQAMSSDRERCDCEHLCVVSGVTSTCLLSLSCEVGSMVRSPVSSVLARHAKRCWCGEAAHCGPRPRKISGFRKELDVFKKCIKEATEMFSTHSVTDVQGLDLLAVPAVSAFDLILRIQ